MSNYKNAQGYGAGAGGNTFDDLLGFESGTAGFQGNINQRIHTSMGHQSNDPAIMAGFDPYRGGHVISKVLVWPAFFEEKAIKIGQILLEDQFIGFEGVESNSLNTITRETGAVKRESTYVTNYKEGNGKVTIKFPEFKGSLGRKWIDYWLFGMSDPRTGHTHMYGKTHLAAVQANLGMVYMTIVTGPSRRPDDIEFVGLWTGLTPNTELIDQVSNSDVGEEGSAIEYSVPFAGIGFDRYSPELHKLGKMIVHGVNFGGQSFLDGSLPFELYSQYAGRSPEEMRAMFGADQESRFAATAQELDFAETLATREELRNGINNIDHS